MQKRFHVVSASPDSLYLGFLQSYHVTLIKGSVFKYYRQLLTVWPWPYVSLYLTHSQQLFSPTLHMSILIALIYDFLAICLFSAWHFLAFHNTIGLLTLSYDCTYSSSVPCFVLQFRVDIDLSGISAARDRATRCCLQQTGSSFQTPILSIWVKLKFLTIPRKGI